MDLVELKAIVRETLKNRENWREGTTRRKRRSKKRSRTGGKGRIERTGSATSKDAKISPTSKGTSASPGANGGKNSKPLSKKALRMAEGAMRNAILTYGL
jgi:hypothetical protein